MKRLHILAWCVLLCLFATRASAEEPVQPAPRRVERDLGLSLGVEAVSGIPMLNLQLTKTVSARFGVDLGVSSLYYFNAASVGGRYYPWDWNVAPYVFGRVGALSVECIAMCGNTSGSDFYAHLNSGLGVEFLTAGGFNGSAEMGVGMTPGVYSVPLPYGRVGLGYRW